MATPIMVHKRPCCALRAVQYVVQCRSSLANVLLDEDEAVRFEARSSAMEERDEVDCGAKGRLGSRLVAGGRTALPAASLCRRAAAGKVPNSLQSMLASPQPPNIACTRLSAIPHPPCVRKVQQCPPLVLNGHLRRRLAPCHDQAPTVREVQHAPLDPDGVVPAVHGEHGTGQGVATGCN